MARVYRITRNRRQRRSKHRHNPQLRLGISCTGLLGLILIFSLLSIAILYSLVSWNLPPIEKIATLLEPPNGLYLKPTQFYDRTGQHVIYTLNPPNIEKRFYAYLDKSPQIPQTLIDAVIAEIDPEFWIHQGTFWLRWQSQPETIAERLIDSLLLQHESNSWRKTIRKKLLAWQMNTQYGKDKVLEWYLNSVYLGNLAYGVDTAARVYFGKSVSELNLAEAAMLAGAIETPALNPLDAPQAAKENQTRVLDAMIRHGFITEEEAAHAREIEIATNAAEKDTTITTPAFIKYVLNQLETIVPIEDIERGGFQVFTTLDIQIQTQINCAAPLLENRLRGTNDLTTNSQSCPINRYLQSFTTSTPLPEEISSSIIVIDPQTGEILGLTEDAPIQTSPLFPPGQPGGSIITPFIYLTAFTLGYSPGTMFWDIPTNTDSDALQIRNPDGEYHGPVRLRIALANDYLNVTAKLLAQIGQESVLSLMRNLGLKDISPPLLPDGKSITLISLTHAYATLANQGLRISWHPSSTEENPNLTPMPVSIIRVVDQHGNIVFESPPTIAQPIVAQPLAYLINHILSDETARWISLGHPNILEIGRPAAVKLGHDLDYTNTWAIGYTPQIVVGVWAGTTDNQPSAQLSPKFAASLWRGIIQYITRDMPAEEFPIPPGISIVSVCDPSGMLPTADCPTVVNEVFLQGNEPNQPDRLYQSFQINRETKRLATVFTPLELVETKTYMIIPPEARSWAEQVNLEVPPSEYDTIYQPKQNPFAQLQSPAMFAYISKAVPIRGTANADDFSSYRIQVGKGLNPLVWVLIQDDTNTPITNDILGTWDTTGFEDGLYAIQLIVTHEDLSVDTSTIQVTVDNTPPFVEIPYPEAGQVISYRPGNRLTFRADVSDNLDISKVTFYIGSRLLDTQTTPPYATTWQMSPGTYMLRVVAEDKAGNTSEAQVTFTIKR